MVKDRACKKVGTGIETWLCYLTGCKILGSSINFSGLHFPLVYDGGFVSTNWVNVLQHFHHEFHIVNAQKVQLLHHCY